jgi:deferrochelatase/peroxidase EfeB
MVHSLATAAIPFDDAKAEGVMARLRPMGAPPTDEWRQAVDGTGVVHFMSINIARETLPGKAHLLVEVSADGGAEEALRAVAAALDRPLREVFADAGLELGRDGVAGLMIRHYLPIGQGWFAKALGLPFDGSPGMSVKRLRAERDLAHKIGGMTDILSAPLTAREKLEKVRRTLWDDEGNAKWAFAPEPAPVLDPAPDPPADPTAPIALTPSLIVPLLPSAVATLLWPVIPVALLLWFGLSRLFWPVGWLGAILLGLLLTAIIVLLVCAGAGAWALAHLRHLENTDPAVDRPPDPAKVGKMMKSEGVYAHGLLAAVSTIKSGHFRRDFILRFAFWFILGNVRLHSRPGYLGPIGVIHFARWFRLPRTDKLFFWSNYDGAWESYVEDFIQLGHDGVTAIWSNTRDFPRTHNLFEDGASDGDRLRRWARNQMYPPLFWYSAYPKLTLTRIRTNAAIRLGLASARTDDDAENWLSCFGSAPRPPSILDRAEVPTLVFGGRKHLRFAACLVVVMSGGPDRCRSWLRRMAPHITYGDARHEWALAFGLSTTGFDKLGVPAADLDTFPPVFRNGMTAPWRSIALGDVACNASDGWEWGGSNGPADAVLLVYAHTKDELTTRRGEVCAWTSEEGQTIAYDIEMDELPADGSLVHEPFGFADGISQPLLLGTPRARDGRNPLHAMEPGEFVLGHLDNSGHYPATPTVRAKLDPRHLLAETPEPMPTDLPTYVGGGSDGRRDLGRNGTYLVVRQLEQDVAAFKAWLERAAEEERDTPLGRQAADDATRKKLIAAKLMGRWSDGASLVRHSHPPAPGQNRRADNEFLYGQEDPQGLACPFGAHTRRANPRDSLDPTSPQTVAITNRHRIMRVGRPYREGVGEIKQGTLFMCLNADIERQFEFLQQTWVLGRSFQALEDEADPLNGRSQKCGEKVFTVPTRDGPVILRNLSDFVRVRGGGYFFMPARRTMRFLASM